MAPRRSPSLPLLGAPPRERADAAGNRQKILAAARRMLGHQSIDSIRMDELAEAAGVGKGTLYRRFHDRSALCHALLDDAERTLQEQVLAGFSLGPQASPQTRFEALLDALTDFALTNVALLAEAEVFARGELERLNHAPRRWRIRALVNAMTPLPNPPAYLELTAEMVLACLEPHGLRRHLGALSDPSDDDIRKLREACVQVIRRLVSCHCPSTAVPNDSSSPWRGAP